MFFMNLNDTNSKEPDELNWADYFDSLVEKAWNESRSRGLQVNKRDPFKVTADEAKPSLVIQH
jgi:hypothetical protein